jgi:hypothetical protein
MSSEPGYDASLLNVCGIKSKLLNPDFDLLIKSYDVLIFTETKTDEFDELKLPEEYTYFAKTYIDVQCVALVSWMRIITGVVRMTINNKLVIQEFNCVFLSFEFFHFGNEISSPFIDFTQILLIELKLPEEYTYFAKHRIFFLNQAG